MMGDGDRARALFRNAEDTFQSTIKSASKSPRFLVMNYYSAVVEYLQALTALEGYKVKSKDHHKELIEFLSQHPSWTPFELTLLDNLRRIRNDLQYYGSKSDKDVSDFYEMNKGSIIEMIGKIRKFVRSKL